MEASTLLNNATPTQQQQQQSLLKSSSLTSTSQSNDNQIAAAASADVTEGIDNSSAQQSIAISKDVGEKSSSLVSTQISDHHSRSDNHHDSSIKLKRCKHGRIIIKDLSKKKLAQPSDNGADTITSKHSNESNNNHIISEDTSTNDNGTENELNKSSIDERLNLPSTEELRIESNNELSNPQYHSQSRSQPRTPNKSNEHTPELESGNKISPPHNTDKRGSSRCLFLRARARSRSSNESLSPSPVNRNARSPPRRSRNSRSPARRGRSSSRDRIRGRSSRRRCDSPSPRRQDRSSSSRRRRERKRSPSRRQHRTPDRHRRSDAQKCHKDSSAYRSPSRKLPRSRSTSRRRNRRNDSPNLSKDSSRYDRYSHISRERSREQFDKAPHLQSPNDRRLHADAIDSTAVGSYISANQNNLNNQSTTKQNVVQASTKSSLSHVIAAHQQPSPRKFSPDQAQVVEEASPGRSPVAPSPATPPSNGDSASSDIYDPEGPIIPISPCDSPPISPIASAEPSRPNLRSASNEKNGEDDVPSSAVQLNQQEKYLQKLNRQERVIEEVKVALRPFYQNRSIDKEQYKDVLRRAVPKICHSKNGEINPIKIRALVDAYVKKMKRH